MSINRRRFITIVAGASFAGIAFPAVAKPMIWRGVVLGADAKLAILGLPNHDAKRLIDRAIEEANRLENIFSLYRPESSISDLNRFGVLENPPLDFISLLSTVDRIYNASGGYFDPTIQPLWETFAEHRGRPSSELIEESIRLVGWENVKFSPGVIKFGKRDMAMTLNGIAQGFITDRIAQLFRNEGLKNAIVKMGEISALGCNDDGNPWDIGLANLGDGVADETIQLTDNSIATSSAGAAMFDEEIGHILNPKQGMPSHSLWQRVSVIHKSATIADGVSTAASLMNEGKIADMLKHIGGSQLLAKYHNGKRYTYQS